MLLKTIKALGLDPVADVRSLVVLWKLKQTEDPAVTRDSYLKVSRNFDPLFLFKWAAAGGPISAGHSRSRAFRYRTFSARDKGLDTDHGYINGSTKAVP